jgi:hypothetical protein
LSSSVLPPPPTLPPTPLAGLRLSEMERPCRTMPINVLERIVEATGAVKPRSLHKPSPLNVLQFPVALESRRLESSKCPYGVPPSTHVTTKALASP